MWFINSMVASAVAEVVLMMVKNPYGASHMLLAVQYIYIEMPHTHYKMSTYIFLPSPLKIGPYHRPPREHHHRHRSWRRPHAYNLFRRANFNSKSEWWKREREQIWIFNAIRQREKRFYIFKINERNDKRKHLVKFWIARTSFSYIFVWIFVSFFKIHNNNNNDECI